MKHRHRLAVLALAAMTLVSALARGENVAQPGVSPNACPTCSAILAHGPFNTIDASDRTQLERAVSIVREWNEASISTQKGGGGFKVPGFSAGGGGETSNTGQSGGSSDLRDEASRKNAVSLLIKLASPELISAWKQAVIAHHGPRYGLRGEISRADRGKVATASISWIPTSRGESDPVIRSISVQNAVLTPESASLVTIGNAIPYGHDSLSLHLTGLARSRSAVVVLNTNKGALTLVADPIEDPQISEYVRSISGVWYYLHLRRAPSTLWAWPSEKEDGVVEFGFVNHEGRRGTGKFYPAESRVLLDFDDRVAAGQPTVVCVKHRCKEGDDAIVYLGFNGDAWTRAALNP